MHLWKSGTLLFLILLPLLSFYIYSSPWLISVPFFAYFLFFFPACHLFVSTSLFLWEHNSVANCLRTNSAQGLSYHCSWKTVPLLHASRQQKDLACCSQAQATPKEVEKKLLLPEILSFAWSKLLGRLWKLDQISHDPYAEGHCLPLAQGTRLHHCTW